MNWLLIAVIAFLIVYVIRGYSNGLIKTVFSIFAVVIALILAVTISPYVSKALQSNEKVFGMVNDKVSIAVLEKSEKTKEENKDAGQTEIINQLPFPQGLKNALVENNNSEVYKIFNVESFEAYISNYITCIILNAISFMIVFLLAVIIVKIVANILDVISKLPLINGINKLGGLIIGFVHGLIVLWVLCIVLTVFSSTDVAGILFGYMNESRFLSAIYDNNLLLNIITNIAKVFF